MLLRALIFSIFIYQNSLAEDCIDKSNNEYCVKLGYGSSKLPPELPLQINMQLGIQVSNFQFQSKANVALFVHNRS